MQRKCMTGPRKLTARPKKFVREKQKILLIIQWWKWIGSGQNITTGGLPCMNIDQYNSTINTILPLSTAKDDANANQDSLIRSCISGHDLEQECHVETFSYRHENLMNLPSKLHRNKVIPSSIHVMSSSWWEEGCCNGSISISVDEKLCAGFYSQSSTPYNMFSTTTLIQYLIYLYSGHKLWKIITNKAGTNLLAVSPIIFLLHIGFGEVGDWQKLFWMKLFDFTYCILSNNYMSNNCVNDNNCPKSFSSSQQLIEESGHGCRIWQSLSLVMNR